MLVIVIICLADIPRLQRVSGVSAFDWAPRHLRVLGDLPAGPVTHPQTEQPTRPNGVRPHGLLCLLSERQVDMAGRGFCQEGGDTLLQPASWAEVVPVHTVSLLSASMPVSRQEKNDASQVWMLLKCSWLD